MQETFLMKNDDTCSIQIIKNILQKEKKLLNLYFNHYKVFFNLNLAYRDCVNTVQTHLKVLGYSVSEFFTRKGRLYGLPTK